MKLEELTLDLFKEQRENKIFPYVNKISVARYLINNVCSIKDGYIVSYSRNLLKAQASLLYITAFMELDFEDYDDLVSYEALIVTGIADYLEQDKDFNRFMEVVNNEILDNLEPQNKDINALISVLSDGAKDILGGLVDLIDGISMEDLINLLAGVKDSIQPLIVEYVKKDKNN